MQPTAYFFSAALTLAVVVAVFRLVVPASYRRRGRLSWAASAAQYLAILAWVAFGWFNLPVGWPAVRVGAVQEAVGWVLFVGGWALVVAGLARLGVRRSHGLEVAGLRQTGLYSLTRNPQAVAFSIAMVGYLVLWPTWRNVGVVMVVAVLAHLMIRAEETHLRSVFGPEYERYLDNVPRYVGPRHRA
jgi:protein-S-isoprenylcysteine O-methyltransferase Ste14